MSSRGNQGLARLAGVEGRELMSVFGGKWTSANQRRGPHSTRRVWMAVQLLEPHPLVGPRLANSRPH